MRTCRLTFVVFLLSALRPACAQEWIAQGWSKALVQSATLLKARDYDRALKVSSRVTNDMVQLLSSGDPSTKAFGLAITHKALALAGLGRRDEALWYWHTVLALYPAYGRSDLSAFGEAGQFLSTHNIPGHPPSPSRTPIPKDAVFVEPKPLRQPKPEYPEGALALRVSGNLVVEVVITTDGRVMYPRVIEPLRVATLSYAALEAVKDWRYSPATVNGEPVEVLLTVTVHYSLRR